MHFAKMHALGNDFMVIDAISQKVYLNSKTISMLADRNRGIGFDQLLLIEPPYDPDCDFHYRIFNADGSEVSQCGNGARCFALFVTLQGLTNKRFIDVTTNNGRMVLEMIGNNQVKVNMGQPIWEPKRIPFTANSEQHTYLIQTNLGVQLCGVVSMGNPHCVVKVNDIKNAPVHTVGPLLEKHERFPEKTNVPFIEIISPTECNVRVWERGCGETQACGSGCCGAIAVAIKQGWLAKGQDITVHALGGDLIINWEGDGNPLYMTGPATYVYDGYISSNNLKSMRANFSSSLNDSEGKESKELLTNKIEARAKTNPSDNKQEK